MAEAASPIRQRGQLQRDGQAFVIQRRAEFVDERRTFAANVMVKVCSGWPMPAVNV
ncbi:hypothetical protein LMG28727_00953 [Paraburkholderia kirstenboschensis]|nr:hypothetical protein LMG28727_00953 [Paraburkholderia kirstenboschensis]